MEFIEITYPVDIAIKLEDVITKMDDLGLGNRKVRRYEVDSDSPSKTPNVKPRVNEPCCGGGKKSPSMLRKAKAYIKLMREWYKVGAPLVDKKIVIERLNICRVCDSLIKDWECSECGCPMMEKSKMDMKNLCKLNKW